MPTEPLTPEMVAEIIAKFRAINETFRREIPGKGDNTACVEIINLATDWQRLREENADLTAAVNIDAWKLAASLRDHCDNWRKEADRLREENAVLRQGWIDVRERLPESETTVDFVACGKVWLGSRFGSRWVGAKSSTDSVTRWFDTAGQVTHWQPRPAPLKEQDHA